MLTKQEFEQLEAQRNAARDRLADLDAAVRSDPLTVLRRLPSNLASVSVGVFDAIAIVKEVDYLQGRVSEDPGLADPGLADQPDKET